ncbi:MAG TPA: response regulator transcription factor [Candidatus Limnocylindrales bacterium]
MSPADGPIRVAIVDDHPIVRDGTAALLAQQSGIEVVGTAESVDEARELLARDGVDVVLLDIRLGTDSGLRLLSAPPPTTPAGMPAIVVLSAYDYPQYAEAAMRLGAAGYVVKTAPMAELVDAIRRAASGGLAFAIRPGRGLRLSAREADVVRLVVDGLSNDEVGARLGIGARTVETHLRRLFERFSIASRTELVARALREGWLEIPAEGTAGEPRANRQD